MGDLGTTFAEIRNAVCFKAGYGSSYSSAGTARQSMVDLVIKSGLRQFYWPPPINGRVHTWSFMRPVTTISSVGAYSTGTITTSGVTVTGTGTSFDAGITSDYELLLDGVYYPIASRDSATQLTLSVAPPTHSTDSCYSVVKRVYSLPATFGNLIGDLTYVDQVLLSTVKFVGECTIRTMESGGNSAGRPQLVAVRPRNTTGSAAQVRELIFWPAPDAVYTFRYRYAVLPQMLTATTLEYPWGGPEHAETILQSCLAIVEQRLFDTRGPETASWIERLASSIAVDQEQENWNYGYCGDGSDAENDATRYYAVTVNGVRY